MKASALDIKKLIVEVLDLEDLKPEDIDDKQALFGGGLGLDSIDALELGVALRKRYQVQIDADDPHVKRYFRNVSGLVELVNR
jgi:acyl carrier protein